MEMIETNDRLLPLSKVEEMVGYGKTWIYEEIRAGRFPKPLKFGSSSRWSLLQVQAWIAAQRDTQHAEAA
jgi:prophage regulatory protein